jgi:hypothetical protein
MDRTPWRERIAPHIAAARRGSDECWHWPLAIGSDGYGHFGWFGFDDRGPAGSTTAHRAVWQFFNGPADPEMVIDHICRNHPCVNPAHLRQFDRAENMLIGIGPAAANRRKTHCKYGHPLSGPNVRITAKRRECRACHARREAERRKRLRESQPPRTERTICGKGHPLDDANAYIYRGHKRCKECRRIGDRARYARDPSIREKIVSARRTRRES